MSGQELQERYKRVYRIVQRERFMRQEVFKNNPEKMREKVGEMNVLLQDVTAIKDALKELIGGGVEQAALFEAPNRDHDEL